MPTNQAIITITFYYGSGDDPIHRLNKKYRVQNWKDEKALRRLIDDIAAEMNHLSGYGILEIKVKADDHAFEVDYRNKFGPHSDGKTDRHETSYWYRDALRFPAGYYGRGSVVWLIIPRLRWMTEPANPVQKYKPGDTLFQIRAMALGKRKKRRRANSRYHLSYDVDNPFLTSFAQKIAAGILLPPTNRPIRPPDSETYTKRNISWWSLPGSQTTYHKMKKKRKLEEKKAKAEARKQKQREKAGIVYQDDQKKQKAPQVYIIHMGGDGLADDVYKIGISHAPGKRLQSLNTSSPFELELVHKFVADSAEEAEAKLHKKFKASRMSGEWFKLTPAQLAELKQIQAYRDGQFIKNKKPNRNILKRVLGINLF